MGRLTGILGILTMLGLGFLFSSNRKAIRIKTVAWGLGLQFAFAVFVLKVDFGRLLFQKAGDAVNRLLSYAFAGSSFVLLPKWSKSSSCGVASTPPPRRSPRAFYKSARSRWS